MNNINISIPSTDNQLKNIRLVANTAWKTVEVNGEDVDIPEGWEVKKIGSITTCLDSIRKPLSQKERFHKKGTVPYWGANSIVDFVDKELFNGKCILLGEDAAPFFDKSKKVAFISNGPIWPNNHIHVLQSTKNHEFLYFKLNDFDYSKILNSKDRPKLTQGLMNSMEIFLPISISEQSLIAQTLTAQEQHIANLKQQALIERKRLSWLTDELLSGRILVENDPNGQPTVVKYDQQGNAVKSLPAIRLVANTAWKTVEVNGEDVEIPEGWSVQHLEQCAKITAGQSPDGHLISLGQPSSDHLDFHQGNADFGKKFTAHSGKFINSHNAPRKAEKGSLLLSVRAPVGALNYANNDLCFGRGLSNIQSKTNYDLDYIRWQILSCTEKLNQIATGSTFLAVTNKQVSLLEIRVPSSSKEQTLIAQTLTAQEEHISSLEQTIALEEKRLSWLTDELLSGRILIEEVTP